MKTSPNIEVLNLYDETAESYNAMMDTEIGMPIYSETLSRLSDKISKLGGPVTDVSCGSGHMLRLYHDKYDSYRDLVGIDLSPEMIKIAKKRAGDIAKLYTGDMSTLSNVSNNSVAGIINFFAIHHINEEKLLKSVDEWYRVLQSNGYLVLAAWEGSGVIDYGEHSDIVAIKHPESTIKKLLVGKFDVQYCTIEFIKEMDMNAIYIEARKIV